MPRFVQWIWRVCAIQLALGLAAYVHFLLTGSYFYLHGYFWVFGTLFFLLTTAAECVLAFQCRVGFDSDEPMHMAWSMIALAAAARFVGSVMIAAKNWHLNWIAGGTPGTGLVLLEGFGRAGAVVGGPLSMVFLAVGLARVLMVQRKFGVLGGLKWLDKLLLAIIVAFSLSQIGAALPLVRTHPSPVTMLLWTSDPLLALLLVEAVLVRRSVLRVGDGLLARCWGMYVIAIVATSAGDAGIWAASSGWLSGSLMPLTWYIWFIAAAAFASAPAYQLAAMSLPLTRERLELR
jgi:hypothetical protein